MLKKRFISVALSALFLFTALTPAALAAGEASTRPDQWCPFSMLTSTRQAPR